MEGTLNPGSTLLLPLRSLGLLKGVIKRMKWGTTKGITKGDTRSLDYSSYKVV